MDAISLLEDQHNEVDAIFERIENTDDPSAKEALFVQVADALAIHAKIEETFFYPASEAKLTDDMLLESVEEHLAVKRVITDLLKMKGSDRNFDAKCTVLKEQVQHHVKEEREELFPKVRKLLSKEQLDALGQEMFAFTEEHKGKSPRLAVPAEIQHAAPLPQPEARG
jgi:hemerythrin-like domain-containing protein